MMKRVAAATFLALVTSLAIAQTPAASAASAPLFRSGDSWRYQYQQELSDKGWYRESVQSVADNEAVLRIENDIGARYLWTYDSTTQSYLRFYAYSSKLPDGRGRILKDSSADDPLIRFPLDVGKSWSIIRHFRTDGDPMTERLTAKVVQQEETDTPAGRFRTFKIEVTGFWTNERYIGAGGTGRHFETYWYAPAVKRWVRRELKSYGTSMAHMWTSVVFTRTDELLEFHLQPDEANAPPEAAR